MFSILKRWAGNAKTRLQEFLFPAEPDGGQWIEGRLEWPRGACLRRERSELAYRLYQPVPAAKGASVPLLVMLHGCKQNSQIFAEGTQITHLADRHGFAVLFPEQSREANPYCCWNWFSSAGTEEAEMIARLVQETAHQYPIERSRIYVAGMSAGGAMARILAVHHGELFAACAVHSALMYRAAKSPMTAVAAMQRGSAASPQETIHEAARISGHNSAFVPTLVIHGNRDDVVNPINAAQTVEQCQTLALGQSLSSAPLLEASERLLTGHGRPYLLRDYSRQGHVLIRKITVEGLAHAWSGGDPRHPFNDPEGPSANELVWDFIKQHARRSQEANPANSWRFPDMTRRWKRGTP